MKQYLFLIDLDGTLLKESSTSEISDANIAAIQRAIASGHIVCIATGRPWSASRKAYQILGLKTVIANYNGAQIHNPSDYDFIPHISYMNLNDVMYILGDEKINSVKANLAIEGPGWVTIENRDANLENVFGFRDASKFRVGVDFHKMPLKPTGVIIDTKPGINVNELMDYLTRTYGDLAEFSSWSKGQGLTPVFDVTNVGVSKAKALSLMARYYNVSMKRTIAIGDGYNDVPMFNVAEFSVAMHNASDDIKQRATWTTSCDNCNDGVAEFINEFLDDLGSGDQVFVKRLRKRRKEILNLNHLDQLNKFY